MSTSREANKPNISPASSPNLSKAKLKSTSPERLEPSKSTSSSGPTPQSEPSKPEIRLTFEREPSVSAPEPDTKVARELTPAAAETVPAKSILDQEDIIDMDILGQILELDEPDNHEFSMGMAWAYFDQAQGTFRDMRTALDDEDLPKLSALGHFLKGSSAALGIVKVRESCERIQHYGNLRDEGADKDLSQNEALEKVDQVMMKVQEEYDEAEQWLRKYYEVNAPNETPPDA